MNLDSLVTELGKANKHKRLAAIEEYINEMYPNADCVLAEPSDLLNYSNLGFTEQDLDAFFEIVNQSFPQGEPYFVFNMQLVQGITSDVLIAHINSSFVAVDISEEYRLTASAVSLDTEVHGTLKFRYEQYKVITTRTGRERDNERKLSFGEVTCEFLFLKNILLVNAGDQRLGKITYDYLKDNFYNMVNVTILKVDETSFRYEGPREVNQKTVFHLELITNKLIDDTHAITDYRKLGFENLRNQRVKTIKLGGSDLLNSTEVAEQVKNQFTLKLSEIRMSWVVTPDLAVFAVVALYSGHMVKIVLRDISNENYKFDVVLHVVDKIRELLAAGITLVTTSTLLNHYFTGVVARQRTQELALITSVREKMLTDPSLQSSAEPINNFFDGWSRNYVG